jgi:hypothetical protein
MRLVSLSYPTSGAKEKKRKESKGDSCEEVSERLKRVWTTASIAFI